MIDISLNLQRIRAYMHHMDWSRIRLAKEAGLKTDTLRKIKSETWNPTAGTIEKLESIIPNDFDPDKIQSLNKQTCNKRQQQ